MKKLMAFVLTFLLLFSSNVALAAGEAIRMMWGWLKI